MEGQSRLLVSQFLERRGVVVRDFPDPVFQSTLSPQRDRAGDALLPYAVVLDNQTDLAVVGYSLKWEGSDPSGQHFEHFLEWFDSGRFQAIPAHSRKLLSIEQNLNTAGAKLSAKRVADLTRAYTGSRAIRVSVDTLMFEDGSSAGPRSTKFYVFTAAHIRAEQTVFSQFANHANAESTEAALHSIVDEAFETAVRVMPPIKKEQGDFYRWARHAPDAASCETAMRGYIALGLLARVQQVGRDEMIRNVQQAFQRKKYPQFKEAR